MPLFMSGAQTLGAFCLFEVEKNSGAVFVLAGDDAVIEGKTFRVSLAAARGRECLPT